MKEKPKVKFRSMRSANLQQHQSLIYVYVIIKHDLLSSLELRENIAAKFSTGVPWRIEDTIGGLG